MDDSATNPVVYLLGAGVNQELLNLNQQKPPLAKNFFQLLLKDENFCKSPFGENILGVLNYIWDFWKKDSTDLENEPFNLEECFTFMFLEGNKTEPTHYGKFYHKYTSIQLKSILCEFLKSFDFSTESESNHSLCELGRLILNEEPTVITFNYDCLIERAFTIGSNNAWNPLRAYGYNADLVQLPGATDSEGIEGIKYYNLPENKPYHWKLLKLHGSINWYSSKEPFEEEFPIPGEEAGQISILNPLQLTKPYISKGGIQPDTRANPIIITPILYKNYFFDRRPFDTLWQEALESLTKCKQLVVIGYSFPPTDFPVRQLLLNAFQENNLEELVIVNPDTSVVKILKDTVHYRKPVTVCKSLTEFLDWKKNSSSH